LNCLRAVDPADGLVGRGGLVKAGKRLVIVRSEVRSDGGALVADGSFTHAVLG
jgi:acyl-coenzyme A thioesterase PaaI-like protein